MNANELADNQAFETNELTMWIRHETATMLRQQQAEIEALKKGIIKIREGCSNVKTDDDCTKEVKQLATLIIRDCNMTLQRLEDD
jgi:hypothetical protein